MVQGGEDPQDALSCRSFSAKEPLIIGFFLRKETRVVQGGEDPQDVLSCRSFSAKEPLIAAFFCGKRFAWAGNETRVWRRGGGCCCVERVHTHFC